jgi:hypothetical protein
LLAGFDRPLTKGEEWDMSQHILYCLQDKSGLNYVSTWDFHSFPHRAKQFKFKLYSPGASNQWKLLAEFRAANPAPSP